VSRRLALIIAGAILAVAAWLVARGRGGEPSARRPETAAVDAGAAAGPHVAGELPGAHHGPGSGPPRPRPALPGDDAAPAEPPFAGEPRTPDWADAHEDEIRSRFDAMVQAIGAPRELRLERLDCRSWRCELDVAADRAAPFDDLIARFQDERGFYGWAHQLLLRDLRRDGEQARVTAVLWFDER